jgi:hypothetical protein
MQEYEEKLMWWEAFQNPKNEVTCKAPYLVRQLSVL